MCICMQTQEILGELSRRNKMYKGTKVGKKNIQETKEFLLSLQFKLLNLNQLIVIEHFSMHFTCISSSNPHIDPLRKQG